jgi:hypothetical protein
VKSKLLLCLALVLSGGLFGCCDTNNRIASIEHDGLHFSISIDDADKRFLKIIIPEKDDNFRASSRPSVQLRVQMKDDSVIEGVAKENPPYYSSGGWTEVNYLFALGKRVSVDKIHSVTITIDGQRYTAYPF